MAIKKISVLCLAVVAAAVLSGCSGIVWAEESQGEMPIEVKRAASNRLESVLEEGRIVIGISPDYAPFAFPVQTQGEEGLSFAGADIELGKYIAGQLGVEAEFHTAGFEECLADIAGGGADMALLGMLPTPEREEQVDFTDVYYRPGRQVVLLGERQAERIKSLEDLAGKTVAAQYGSLQAQLLAEQLLDSIPELTADAQEAVLKLRMGTVDAVVLDEALAAEAAAEYEGLAVLEEALSYEYGAEGTVAGVAKGEEELLARINEILAEAAEENMYLKWLDAATRQAKDAQ